MDHERTPDPQLEDMIPEDRKSKQSVRLNNVVCIFLGTFFRNIP